MFRRKSTRFFPTLGPIVEKFGHGRVSAMVQRDLVGFFRRWEYPLSTAAETTIREFDFEVWLPPGW